MSRIIAVLAALVALQPMATQADWMDDIAGPGCVRARNGSTAWHCSADAPLGQTASQNVNGDKPASRHQPRRSKQAAEK